MFGNLRHRLELDGLIEFIDQRGARLARAAVDDHRADAANLFETIHVPRRRRRLLALPGDRILANLHQARDHVEVLAVRNLELFPTRGRVGIVAAFDMNLDCVHCFIDSLIPLIH